MPSRSRAVIGGICLLAAAVVYDGYKKSDTPKSDMIAMADTQNISTLWKRFTSKENDFSVLLPSLPQHVQEKVTLPNGQDVVEYHMYLSQEKNGTTFLISVIHYPEVFDTSKPEILLDGVMKEMLSGNTANTLGDVKKSLFKNCPSVDFLLENKEFELRCRTFLHSKTLFVLSVIDRKSAADINKIFNKFANSFELLSKETVKKEPVKT